MTYLVTDANDIDILGCEQTDLGSARCAARTLVIEDGVPEARIWPEGWRFPAETFRLDGWGNLTVQSSDLVRSLR
jgi:hypothetical protein